MRQITDLIEIDTEFQYNGVKYDDWFNTVEQNILSYQAYFQEMEWTKEELENISHRLVETGRVFAEQQGFGPGVHGPAYSLIDVWNTGNLYYHIKSEVNDKKIRFYNDAKNSRGQPYAGHLEYGFHDRGGNLVPARPFMRPAFYAVAEGSKGNFRGIMKGLLDNIWSAQGFRGISSLSFGRSMGSQSIFWKNPSQFAGKVSGMSRMREISGRNFRQRMTTSRIKGERKVGFSIRNNQRDFHRTRIPAYDSRGTRIRGNDKWGRSSNRSWKKERDIRQRNLKEGRKVRKSNNKSYDSVRYKEFTSRIGQGGDRSTFTPSSKSKSSSKETTSRFEAIVAKKSKFKSPDWNKKYVQIKDLNKYKTGSPSSAARNKYGRKKLYLIEK